MNHINDATRHAATWLNANKLSITVKKQKS